MMGTSLKVYPFAGLISKVSKDTPRVLINMVKAGDFERDPEFNYRDIMALGDLQETTWKIVKMLGWEVTSLKRVHSYFRMILLLCLKEKVSSCKLVSIKLNLQSFSTNQN